ncbi:hypothetical protein [Nesterenkonia alba]|uniref:hypothetical protein n=1 Tax=Nesterenkonia alba TaxID=515814 RepID=UPI0003B40EB0|nr:hypothetical protein [Nesterenkonia alba]
MTKAAEQTEQTSTVFRAQLGRHQTLLENSETFNTIEEAKQWAEKNFGRLGSIWVNVQEKRPDMKRFRLVDALYADGWSFA